MLCFLNLHLICKLHHLLFRLKKLLFLIENSLSRRKYESIRHILLRIVANTDNVNKYLFNFEFRLAYKCNCNQVERTHTNCNFTRSSCMNSKERAMPLLYLPCNRWYCIYRCNHCRIDLGTATNIEFNKRLPCHLCGVLWYPVEQVSQLITNWKAAFVVSWFNINRFVLIFVPLNLRDIFEMVNESMMVDSDCTIQKLWTFKNKTMHL